jgi:hypothetical protein
MRAILLLFPLLSLVFYCASAAHISSVRAHSLATLFLRGSGFRHASKLAGLSSPTFLLSKPTLSLVSVFVCIENHCDLHVCLDDDSSTTMREELRRRLPPMLACKTFNLVLETNEPLY